MSELLTTEEAAKAVGVSEMTMRRFRRNGGGPPYVRMGPKLIRYSAESLRLWVASRESASSDAEKVA